MVIKRMKIFDANNQNYKIEIGAKFKGSIINTPIILNDNIIGFIPDDNNLEIIGEEWFCDVSIKQDQYVEFKNYEIMGEWFGDEYFLAEFLSAVIVKEVN